MTKIKRINYSDELYKNSGIYCIKNTINNKMYIGITNDKLFKRISRHDVNLRNNKHVNEKLQNAYNKYGAENFVFEIVELIPKDNIELLKDREIYYIKKFDTFHNGYNMTEGGDYNNQFRLIFCYRIINTNETILFELYNIYKGGREAARDLNYSESNIYKCIDGKYRSSKLKNFIFVYENETSNITNTYLLEKYNKINSLPKKGDSLRKHVLTEEEKRRGILKRQKKVGMYDLNNNFVKEFDSINLCAKFLNIHAANITKVVNGKQKSAKGYTFKVLQIW